MHVAGVPRSESTMDISFYLDEGNRQPDKDIGPRWRGIFGLQDPDSLPSGQVNLDSELV